MDLQFTDLPPPQITGKKRTEQQMKRNQNKLKKYFLAPNSHNSSFPDSINPNLSQDKISFPVTDQQRVLNFFTIYNQSIPQNKTLLAHLCKLEDRLQTHIKIKYGKNDQQLINFREMCQKREKGMEIEPEWEKKKSRKKKAQDQQGQGQKKVQRVEKQQLQLMLREKQLHPFYECRQKKRIFVIEQMVKCWMQKKAGLKTFIRYYYPAKYLDQTKYREVYQAIMSIIYTRIQKFVFIFYGGDLHKDKLPNSEARKIQQAFVQYRDMLEDDVVPVFEAVVKGVFDLYGLKNYRDRHFPHLQKKTILNLHYKLICKFTSSTYKFSGRDMLSATAPDPPNSHFDPQQKSPFHPKPTETQLDDYDGTRYYKYKHLTTDMTTPALYCGDELVNQAITVAQPHPGESKQALVARVDWSFQLELHLLKLYLGYKKEAAVMDYLRVQVPKLAMHSDMTKPFMLRLTSMNRRMIFQLQKQFKARLKVVQRSELSFREYKFITCSGSEKQVLMQRSSLNQLKMLMADYYINVTSKLQVCESGDGQIVQRVRQESEEVFNYNLDYLGTIIDVVFEMIDKKRHLPKVMPETEEELSSRYFLVNDKLYKTKPNSDQYIQIALKTPFYSSGTMTKDIKIARNPTTIDNTSEKHTTLDNASESNPQTKHNFNHSQQLSEQFEIDDDEQFPDNPHNQDPNLQEYASIQSIPKIQQPSTDDLDQFFPKRHSKSVPLEFSSPYTQSYTHFVRLRSSELPLPHTISLSFAKDLLKRVMKHIDQKSAISQFQLQDNVMKDCLQAFLLFNGINGVKERFKQISRDGKIKNDREIRPFFAKIMSKALRFAQYHFIRSMEINKKTQLTYCQMKFLTLKKQEKRALCLHKGSHNMELMLSDYYLAHSEQAITRRDLFEGNNLRYLTYIMHACLKILEYRQNLSGIIQTEPEHKKQFYPVNLAYQFPYTVKSSEHERKLFAKIVDDEVEVLKIDQELKEIKALCETHPQQMASYKDQHQAGATVFNLLTQVYQNQWQQDCLKHEQRCKDMFGANGKEILMTEKASQQKLQENPSIKSETFNIKIEDNREKQQNLNKKSLKKQDQRTQISLIQQNDAQNHEGMPFTKDPKYQSDSKPQPNISDLKIIADEDTFQDFLAFISQKIPKWGWPSNKAYKKMADKRKNKHNQKIIQEVKTSVDLLDNNPSLFGLFQMLQNIGTAEIKCQESTVADQHMLGAVSSQDSAPMKKRKPNEKFTDFQMPSQNFDSVQTPVSNQKGEKGKARNKSGEFLGVEFKKKSGVELQLKKKKMEEIAKELWEETRKQGKNTFKFEREINQEKNDREKWQEAVRKDWAF